MPQNRFGLLFLHQVTSLDLSTPEEAARELEQEKRLERSCFVSDTDYETYAEWKTQTFDEEGYLKGTGFHYSLLGEDPYEDAAFNPFSWYDWIIRYFVEHPYVNSSNLEEYMKDSVLREMKERGIAIDGVNNHDDMNYIDENDTFSDGIQRGSDANTYVDEPIDETDRLLQDIQVLKGIEKIRWETLNERRKFHTDKEYKDFCNWRVRVRSQNGLDYVPDCKSLWEIDDWEAWIIEYFAIHPELEIVDN